MSQLIVTALNLFNYSDLFAVISFFLGGVEFAMPVRMLVIDKLQFSTFVFRAYI
jgi:hypothetical protein